MDLIRKTSVLVILLVSTVLISCGGGDDNSSSSVAEPAATATTAPAPTQEPEPAPAPAPTTTTTTTCPTIHPYERYIAIGDSITAGIGDDVIGDNVTADGCYEGGGFPPVLIYRLNKSKGRKHAVINKGVPGDGSFEGSKFVGGLLGRDAIHFLVMYGTNDTHRVTEGFATDPSEFKENMQSIIDQIHSVGKRAYLAKIPPVLGEEINSPKYPDLDQGPKNQLILQYNKIIDDLVRINGIEISPPDFYSYFKSRPELYSDNLHFNGRGYQAMGNLWWLKLK